MPNKLKKAAIILMSCLLAFVFASCKSETVKSDKLSVVAVGFTHFDFARQIAGDKADIRMLIKPGSEAHTFEPTPFDISLINNCDIFIYTGGESDEWIEGLLEANDNKDMLTVRFTDAVELLTEVGEEDEYDEHVWTSPKNALKISEKVKDAFVSADGENGEYYEERYEKYSAELKKLDEATVSAVSSSALKKLVFADRFPILYFVKDYGLDFIAAFPGCAAETEPNAAAVRDMIDTVKSENIPVIFKIELSYSRLADTVSAETGAEIKEWNTCHNISKERFDRGDTYISLMYENIEILGSFK